MLVGGANGAGCLTTNATRPRAPGLPSPALALRHQHDQLDAQRGAAPPTTPAATMPGHGRPVGLGLERPAHGDRRTATPAATASTPPASTTRQRSARCRARRRGSGAPATPTTRTPAARRRRVALTLGNGVAQNPTESRIAAGIDEPGNAVNFDVYALTHPQLAVDHRFLIEGNASDEPRQRDRQRRRHRERPHGARLQRPRRPGATATRRRSPTPATASTRTSQSRGAEPRRRSRPGSRGSTSPRSAPTTGSAPTPPATCYTPVAAPGPSNVIQAGATASPIRRRRETLTYAYQVAVDDPLAAGITSITNTATVTTPAAGHAALGHRDRQRPAAERRRRAQQRRASRCSARARPSPTSSTTRPRGRLLRPDVHDDRGWPVELLDHAPAR